MKALFFNSNKSIIEENYEEFHPVEAEKETDMYRNSNIKKE